MFFFFSSRKTSNPLFWGMRTSSMTRSMLFSPRIFPTSFGSVVVRISYPFCWMADSKALRIFGSSSTERIFLQGAASFYGDPRVVPPL